MNQRNIKRKISQIIPSLEIKTAIAPNLGGEIGWPHSVLNNWSPVLGSYMMKHILFHRESCARAFLPLVAPDSRDFGPCIDSQKSLSSFKLSMNIYCIIPTKNATIRAIVGSPSQIISSITSRGLEWTTGHIYRLGSM